MIGSSATKAELLSRMEKTRKILNEILRNGMGRPDPNDPKELAEQTSDIVDEIIEALGALNGHPEHDV